MKKDLRNKQFGNLKVMSIHSRSINGHIRYNCICKCGNQCNVLSTHLIQETIKSCGCLRKKGKDVYNWKGFGEISGSFWLSHIVKSADGSKGKRNPVELSITIEDAWNLFLKQNKKCALSGIELKFPTRSIDKSYTSSLDRIDSSKGYIKNNVQWVHKDINIMKNKFDNDYFLLICMKISNNNCEIK